VLSFAIFTLFNHHPNFHFHFHLHLKTSFNAKERERKEKEKQQTCNDGSIVVFGEVEFKILTFLRVLDEIGDVDELESDLDGELTDTIDPLGPLTEGES